MLINCYKPFFNFVNNLKLSLLKFNIEFFRGNNGNYSGLYCIFHMWKDCCLFTSNKNQHINKNLE